MEDRHARHRRPDADRRRRPADGFRAPTTARFDRLVSEAIAGLPTGLRGYLDAVQLAVADVPPPDPRGDGDEVVLGVLQRAARGRRRARAGGDRLVLFRRPLEARARDRHDLAELIQHTVVDELAARFDLDDDRLDELGWS